MNALEKSNLTAATPVKMSKRKSKNRKQHQLAEKTSNNDVNSMNGDSLNVISEKMDDCLHIRENGCTQNHMIEEGPIGQNATSENFPTNTIANLSSNSHQSLNTRSILPKQTTAENHKQAQNHNLIANGDVDHSKQLEETDKSSDITSSIIGSNNNNNTANKTNPKTLSSGTGSKLITSTTNTGKDKSIVLDGNETEDSMKSLDNCFSRSVADSCNHAEIKFNIQNNDSKDSSTSSETESNKKQKEDLQVAATNKPCNDLVIDGSTTSTNVELNLDNAVIDYKEYESELQMQDIMRLIQTELSEPYSIYTYRYFIYNWPKLCFLAAHGDEYVGAIVCKLDMHMNVKRGYIAMLAVKKEYRKMKIGTNLVQKAIEAMRYDGADEVVLETEMKNIPALRLYENLGFVRDKRLFRYYLNGVDALRLKLWFR